MLLMREWRTAATAERRADDGEAREVTQRGAWRAALRGAIGPGGEGPPGAPSAEAPCADGMPTWAAIEVHFGGAQERLTYEISRM